MVEIAAVASFVLLPNSLVVFTTSVTSDRLLTVVPSLAKPSLSFFKLVGVISASINNLSMLFKAGLPVSTGVAEGRAASGGGEKTYNNAYPRKIPASTYRPIFNQVSAPGA